MDSLTQARERLIVALDLPSAHDALELVSRLEGRCLWFKVGLELYLAAGPTIVHDLARRGLRVFLDLKLHDIPNTVAGAVRSLRSSGASLLTVHASGGAQMLAAAVEAATGGGPRLLAVTVLTSMDEASLAQVGVPCTPEAQVLRLAHLANAAGVVDLVCSTAELAPLRAAFGSKCLLVVPGIRPPNGDVGDQRRIATPGDAIRAGASHLVVGRPITLAKDPSAVFDQILEELAAEIR